MNKICAIIPVFNNEKTIKSVVCECKNFVEKVIVIDDGSTDKTSQIVSEIADIIYHKFPRNRGKGAAIKKGFETALQNGFSHAITIDADGQHFAQWIETAINECEKNPENLLVGARTGEIIGEYAPHKNVFARKFGNLWIKIYTGFSLSDTQSGFRVYPIEKMKNIKLKTDRFEFEQEVLVKSAWAGIKLSQFTIPQFYQPREARVSHYRVFRDSVRISWFFTKTAFAKIHFVFIDELKSNVSPQKAAFSFAVGVFFGILPIYGFQIPAALAVSTVAKLNRPLSALGTMISAPPLLPFIFIAAVWLGSNFFPDSIQNIETLAKLFSENKLEFLLKSGKCFIAGSVVLALIMGILSYLTVYPVCLLWKKKK
jgi:glycosyltransferase involved in cell wall biosynthesis